MQKPHEIPASEAKQKIALAKETLSTSLDLRYLGLTSIPLAVVELTKLETLGLRGNQIEEIPEFLANMPNLQELYLDDNQIVVFPNSIFKLTSLRLLSLNVNLISEIPDRLSNLVNLRYLYLSDNRFTEFPPSILQLSNLRELNLSYNRITFLPKAIVQLAGLQKLNLKSNQLAALPRTLQQLPILNELVLHGNPTLGVPEEILGPNDLDVAILGIRPTLPQPILNYYFAQRDSARPLNEAKLILVGRGNVGKTSLVKRLTTGRFNSYEETTQGIKILDWSCCLPNREKVTVHIWDFGGQEIMHATHQFFLTKRTLYLLVLNRRHGGYDEEADYWFRLIRAFGGTEAPVLVALNKQLSEPFDVNRGAWFEKYKENIKCFVETDCVDYASIRLLQERIESELSKLSSLAAPFPTRWFAIKHELATMRPAYISIRGYHELCRKHGEDAEDEQTQLAGFLHDLGIALNYNQDPRLRFAYVLKPEWVTQAIYALIHAFVTNKGLFTKQQASAILQAKDYPPESVDFLLALAEQFELCFPLGDYKKTLLMPQLLDEAQSPLASTFNRATCLNFGYQYPILTEGLLPRFIVRTHHLSQQGTRWKSGVILTDPATQCRALVRADTAERQVQISIDGPEPTRRDLLAIIRYNFDVIHSDYESRPTELVYPIPDKPRDLEELNLLHQAGETTISIIQNRTVTKQSITPLLTAVDTKTPRLRLFLSYSRKDETYIDELRNDLKLMERNGILQTWYDRALTPGEKWSTRILHELNTADLIVCQLSRYFLASDFCALTELKTAIERQQSGEATLIAYVLTECDWPAVPELSQFQVLPQDAKPLARWRNKHEYWHAIAQGIKTAASQPRRSPRRSN